MLDPGAISPALAALPFALQATTDDNFSWQLAFFMVGSLAVIAAAVVIVIWQIFSTARARMSVAREDAYKQLAAQAAEAIDRAAGGFEKTSSELAELRRRTAELERVLKEVG